MSLKLVAMLHEAQCYIKKENSILECQLCPHKCRLTANAVGLCKVRSNIGGKMMTANFEHFSAAHFDPVEKKPFFHFFPGKVIFSLGSMGCNLHCKCCQNDTISQYGWEGRYSGLYLTKERILEQCKQVNENIGVAFTYNEPGLSYEMILESSSFFRSNGLKQALVTNGYFNAKPFKKILGCVDALNIDVKSYDDKSYKSFSGGGLQIVLQNVYLALEAGKHIEITYLLVPGVNDDLARFKEFIDDLAGKIGSNVPLHISRYFPNYKMDEPSTDLKSMLEFANKAKGVFDFVYLGNINIDKFQDTSCPKCNNIVVKRTGYSVSVTGLDEEGCCSNCQKPIAII